MSRTKLVFFGGSKGGVGKSTISHLACLGAVWCNQAAAYVLTDPARKVRDKGRPYDVFDGTEPGGLAKLLEAGKDTPSDGWLILDGGGNRPAFDEEIAKEADLCIFPFRPSQEDMDTVSDDMNRIPNALACLQRGPPTSLRYRPRSLTSIVFPRNFLHASSRR
jgi:chromosome partitioning protein